MPPKPRGPPALRNLPGDTPLPQVGADSPFEAFDNPPDDPEPFNPYVRTISDTARTLSTIADELPDGRTKSRLIGLARRLRSALPGGSA
jgi:hypothetical protein